MSYNCEHGVIGGDEYSCQECAKRDSAELATLRKQLAEAEAELARMTDLFNEAVSSLATAEADCAAMREALEFYGSQKFFAVMPDDGKTRVVPICNEDGSFAHYLAFVNDDGEIARAALTRPTGQSILDELSAARKVCEIAQWQENGGMWPENYADALDAYRAAHKANTGDKQ